MAAGTTVDKSLEALTRAPWRRYVAMGDSRREPSELVASPGVTPLQSADRIAAAMAAARPGLRYWNVMGRDVSVAEVRRTQLQQTLELEPDLVTLCAGATDLREPEFDALELERELEPMYAALTRAGVQIVTFLRMDITAAGVLPPEIAEIARSRMTDMHDVICNLVLRHGAILVDLWDMPECANPELYDPENWQCSAAGEAFIADVTLHTLAQHVSRIRSPESGA